MAPPVSAPPRPTPGPPAGQWPAPPGRGKRRRTFGDFVRGFGALVALAALLGAIPYALVRYIGWPLPHHLPSSEVFNQAITPQVLLRALAVIVWLAWAQFVSCVLVELIAAVRGVGMPARVPGGGFSQFLARQLVAALLMVTASAASFVPNLAHLGGQAPPAPAKAPISATAGAPAAARYAALPASAATAPAANLPALRGESGMRVADDSAAVVPADTSTDTTKLYRVSPPAGRHHDSLWDIAQRHLGDGRRYNEIYALNKDRVQPDGSQLTNASLIRPGWILAMPADATGGDLVAEMTAPPADAPGTTTPPATSGGTSGNPALTPVPTTPVPSLGPVTAPSIATSPSTAPTTAAPTTAIPTTAASTTPAPTTAGPASSAPAISASPTASPTAIAPTTSAPALTGGSPPQQQPIGILRKATAISQSADEIARIASAAAAHGHLAIEPAAPATHPAAARQEGTTTAGRDSGRSSHRGSHAPEESQAPSVDDRVLYGLAGAPLLAAGLLKALGRHRRRQLWHRVFGRRPATATGDGAAAEESIRIGAGEVEVWFLDLALRGLSAALAGAGQCLPAAYSLKLREEGIELMLSAPHAGAEPVSPPAPWYATADGRAWNFPRSRIHEVPADAAYRRFAPYPGLVTIGSTGGDRILIDLEESRGVIAVGGPREGRRAALAALAVELATNSWSDRMTVTLVGFPGDLTALAPARIRHVQTLDEVLPALETEAAERVKALTAAGLTSVLDGRSRASQGSSFPPHFVIVAEEPHPAILARLTATAAPSARVGMGFVVAGDVAGATWQLTVGQDGRITAPLLGIDADAQLLPDDQYTAVLGLFRAVTDVGGSEVAAASVHQSVGYSGPLPDEPPAVFAALLGPLDISGTGVVDPDRAALMREALVFLLHHRDGVHPRVLAAALWPRGATADVAEATFSRLTQWLGTDPHGQPNLQIDPDGRLCLGRYVWSDWDLFQSLQSRARYDASVRSQEQRDQLLAVALDLVRGEYLANREAGRYGWLAYEVAEAQVPAVVADTALQLADARIAAGLAESAIDAVRSGMRGSPDDEELWRGLLRATAATGDQERLRAAVEALYKRTWYVHGVQGLHPRTESLVDELLPTWRELLVV